MRGFLCTGCSRAFEQEPELLGKGARQTPGRSRILQAEEAAHKVTEEGWCGTLGTAGRLGCFEQLKVGKRSKRQDPREQDSGGI